MSSQSKSSKSDVFIFQLDYFSCFWIGHRFAFSPSETFFLLKIPPKFNFLTIFFAIDKLTQFYNQSMLVLIVLSVSKFLIVFSLTILERNLLLGNSKFQDGVKFWKTRNSKMWESPCFFLRFGAVFSQFNDFLFFLLSFIPSLWINNKQVLDFVPLAPSNISFSFLF